MDELTWWTVYSVAFSLVTVRIASYRVCTSPLKYAGKGGESRLAWVVAMLAAGKILIPLKGWRVVCVCVCEHLPLFWLEKFSIPCSQFTSHVYF